MVTMNRVCYFILLVLLTSVIYVEELLGVSNHYLAQHEMRFIVFDLIMWGLLLALLLVIYRRLSKANGPEVAVPVIKKVGIILLMLAASYLLNWFDQQWNPLALPQNQVVIDQRMQAAPYLTTIGNGLIAPTIEELLFRGLFFNFFFLKKTRFNGFLKIIVSGLIFGSMHELAINYNWLIYCAMGWILGATYYWTKDLKCSIILHSLINLL